MAGPTSRHHFLLLARRAAHHHHGLALARAIHAASDAADPSPPPPLPPSPPARSFSSAFSSVHGERPSSEYAKIRKESLESQFGRILGSSSRTIFADRGFGPFLALYRAATISFHVMKLTVWHLLLNDVHKRAEKFRETLIRLGPFYIKLGQALSTRPDILPNAYCQELSKLQDQIPPFPTRIAVRTIESQLGSRISDLFADISPEPIAAASLGQVYKAHLHSGELVAVKVQRPGMTPLLTLDALLFHMIGGQLKRFAKARKDLLVAVNEIVRHMFDEVDYVLEGRNAERFARLYSHESGGNSSGGGTSIKVPKVYWNFTRKCVLTLEWIDGIKLTDAERIGKANLNRKRMIDEGLYCSLRQLLEEGFFHADPHPGNLVATEGGSLAYFDFGMMGDIPRHYRVGLIQMLVHYVNRDSLGLANDFHSLGFVPEGTDLHAVGDALRVSFGEGRRQSNDFQGVMNHLYDVMYEFNFSLPPDYALVIRALGSLEGTAKALDPDFKVIESAYPFVIGRLLEDPSPDMRKILRQLLICDDGSIRWNRLERLIAAISEQSKSSNKSGDGYGDGENASDKPQWRSFDMHSVVAATEDLFHFILSRKGWRVRVFLVQDIVKASDAFLQEATFPGIFDEEITTGEFYPEAVSLAPDAWTAMLFRTLLKPECQKFILDVFLTLAMHSRYKIPETSWICMSRFLNYLDRQAR
uniref:Protein kinase domain-containing protein n=1 Tax=Leersia perrieri TaxID=77586 RepID=A0A0D9WYJ4_9ORYZ